MYDNLLHQGITSLLEQNILQGNFPSALLFVGAQGSGKLTCALETARVLTCQAVVKGEWLCDCPSCKKNKMLVSQNIILAGARDCTPEIAAAKKTFLNAIENNATYLNATRYLFLRSVRKLTARFNPVLLEGDDKLSKISTVISAIDEQLETLDFPHELPEQKKLEKCISDIEKNCIKLEGEYLADSIPVRQIRAASAWAHIKSNDGKKILIIERADNMLEASRNALLKILEEPPEDVVFILTATRRNAVMPTILSRVRTYKFENRTSEEEAEVISKVFHDTGSSIEKYLESFLPIAPETILNAARDFYNAVQSGKIPDVEKIAKDCAGFEPRKIFRIFLSCIEEEIRPLMNTASGTAMALQMIEEIRRSLNNVTLLNEKPVAALEILVRSFSKIVKTHSPR